MDLETFLHAYVRCVLWSSTGDDERPLDSKYDRSDIADVALATMCEECAAFLRANAADIGDRYDDAGHDFWLTRNGHGAGFWDGDWPEAAGQRLTDAAHAAGSSDIYEGDDGKLYVS